MATTMERRPPQLALFLMRFWLASATYEAVAGDLCEEYQDPERTSAWFWRQTFSTVKPNWVGPVWNAVAPMGHVPAGMFSTVRQDVSYALRTLRRSPAFTAVVVAAIALGIGVNTAIFTVLNSVAFRPVPVGDAGRVVSIYQVLAGNVSRSVFGEESFFSLPELRRYQRENQVLSGLTSYTEVSATFTEQTGQMVKGQIVDCNYFPVLDRPPALGRGFMESECAAEHGAPVVVLSDSFWRTHFGGDRSVLGRDVLLNRVAFTVIGVAPPGFAGAGLDASEFWAPLTMQRDLVRVGDGANFLPDDNLSWLVLLGRLRPGVAIDQANANLSVIAAEIDRFHPGRTTKLSVGTATLLGEPEARRQVLSASYLILAGVSLVLLIACANVANLLLARAAFRQREIALRLSVGANRSRLVRQLLTESLTLSVAGGLLGTALAWLGLEATLKALPPELVPRTTLSLQPDWRMLLYTVGLSVAAGLVFGIVPALQSTRLDLTSGLRDEFRLAGRRSWALVRNVLVAAQVATCLVVLIAAGLLARGLSAAQHVDPGFQTRGVLAAKFDLRRDGYSSAESSLFKSQLLARTQSSAGDENVGFAFIPPLTGGGWSNMVFREGLPNDTGVASMLNSVSPQFFGILNLPIVRGRNMTETEYRTAANVALVTESTGRAFWPGQDPVGKRIKLGGDKAFSEVIGVVHDGRFTSLDHLDSTFAFVPQKADDPSFSLLIKTPDTAATARALHAVVAGLDPKLFYEVTTLDKNRDKQEMPSRLLSILSVGLGAFSILLACSGIYGVVNYAVNHRIREIGIRMTLGARRGKVLRLMLKQSLLPVFAGAVVGLALAAAATRLLSKLLFGVSPFDAWTFAAVFLLIVVAALMATLGPAARATRIDPSAALRYE